MGVRRKEYFRFADDMVVFIESEDELRGYKILTNPVNGMA